MSLGQKGSAAKTLRSLASRLGAGKPISKQAALVLPALAICLAAFILRAWRLDYQSFWQDEGFSASLSSGSLAYILRQSFSVEPNPPLYFIFLHIWRMAAGSGEYAIRFLSLIPSVLTVPSLFAFGRRLAGRRLGLLAAGLGAVSPFLVWLAQEARMYTWEALWLCLGGIFLLCALRRERRVDWALFGVASLLAMYTHLYAAFVVAAEALFLLGRRRAWLPGALAAGGAFMLWLPWLVSVSTYSGEASTWRGFIGISDLVHVLMLNFASQAHLPGRLDDLFALLLGLLILAGIALALRSRGGTAGWLPVIWLLFPIAAVYAASFKEPLFSPRYFIVVAPALLLLAAWPLKALPKSAGLFGLAVISAASIWAVERGNTVPAYAKEDYRLAGTYVGARSDPGDAILLVANYIYYPFTYYFHGSGRLLPLDLSPDTDVQPLLAPLAGQYDHIWLVEAHDVFVDPRDNVGKWLRARYTVADEKYIIGIHFIEFDPHPTLPALPPSARPLDVRWTGGPQLAGYELRAGTPEGVRLYWKANGPLAQSYHVSLKLWAANGKLAGQQDGEPLNAGLPFAKFPSGGYVRDDYYINARPGTYTLRMSVYLQDDLPIEGQQDRQVSFGTVIVP